MSATKNPACPAALNIRGEHFGCDMEAWPHDGWAHSSKAAEAIWRGDASDEAHPTGPEAEEIGGNVDVPGHGTVFLGPDPTQSSDGS